MATSGPVRTGGTGAEQSLPLTGTARYVRVVGLSRSGAYGYSVWEVGVWGGL
jgi:hypothetical protein